MPSIEPWLVGLLPRIAPTPARVARAKGTHEHLKRLLWDGRFGNRLKRAFLTGSYSRETAIDPLDDVDMVVLIEPDRWPRNDFTFFSSSKPDAETVLDSFARAIRFRYETSSVRIQRRSVRLKLSHIDVDVVPAIEDASPNHILIPDLEKDYWIRSGPVVHRMDGEEVNRLNGLKFKALVKLLKFWNRQQPAPAQFKSFTIETMAARIFRRYRFSTLEEGCFKYLDFVMALDGQEARGNWSDKCGIRFSWDGTLTVPDIADTGANVAASVTADRRARFVERARLARRRLLEAFQARTIEGGAAKLKLAFRM